MSSDPYPGLVPLSDGEGHRLAQLQRQLEAEDPVLARALRTGQPGACDEDAGGVGHLVVAMGVAVLVLPLLYIAVVGAVLFVIATLTAGLLQRARRALRGIRGFSLSTRDSMTGG